MSFVLIISVLLQFVAAGLAFALIRKTGCIAAWLVISSALLLMAIRRSLSLFHTLTSDSLPINPSGEGVALLISCLMVTGIWLLSGVFNGRNNQRMASTQGEIDERIKTEEELSSKDVLLREMGRIAHIGGWEFNPATGQGTWTEEVARIHDLDPKEETSLEKGLLFYQNASQEKINQALKEAVESGRPYDLKLELVSAKGVHKWVQTIGSPVLEDGKVVRIRGTFQDITEHKMAEQEILDSKKRQEQLADIIEKANLPVAIGYPDGRLGLCNSAFCELTGYSMEELKVIDWGQVLTPPEWLEFEHSILAQLEDTGKPVCYQKEYIHKNGHRVPIEMLTHIVRDSDGEIQFYYAFFTDITERIAAENALRASEKRFEDIALSSADWIWECDAGGKYTFAAGRVQQITGYTPDELIGMTPFGMMTEEEAVRVSEIFRKSAARKAPVFELENIILSKDGRTVHLQTSGVPILDKQGALAGYRGVDRDITEKKLADEELRKYRDHLEQLVEVRAAELEDQHQFSSTILETAPVGIVTYGPDGQCVSANQSAAGLVGASIEQMLAQNFYNIVFWRESGVIDVASKCLQSGEVEEISVQVTTSFGKNFSADLRFARFMVQQEPHLLMTFTDISDRVRYEKALKAALHQLEVSNRELDAFAYSVSHDLRAPLRGIDGFSQALLEDYEKVLDEEGQDDLHRIRAAAQRMGELIEDLLQLSRISRWQLEQKTVDIGMLAGDVIRSLREQQPERVVEVVIGTGLRVEGDPRLMRLVLANLIGNAWKFSRMADGARIEVGRSRNGDLKVPNTLLTDDTAVFYVQDNGAGFDMAYANKLFGAFQRLHTVSEFEGSGIGLATVMRAIQRQGGQVWAEGYVGDGAVFYFSLET